MATLISWESSGGKKGRCDARCHNAKRPKCKCCCGGHYHGAARDGTLEQKVQEFGSQIIKELEDRGSNIKTAQPALC